MNKKERNPINNMKLLIGPIKYYLYKYIILYY